MLQKSFFLGTAGWFSAAAFVKYSGMPYWPLHMQYLTSFGLGAGFIFSFKVFGVPARSAFTVCSLATAVALVLDGAASVLVPYLYSFNDKTPLEALAGICFGAGCGILTSYAITYFDSYGL
jgi:hypothetical protein